jgi:acyl-CoA thioester hydrolase
MTAVAPLDLYLGSVNAWECDENRHLNVRFFAARAMESLGFLAAALDMPRAFHERAASTLVVRDMHVRFLKEAREGAPLSMHGGVASMDDTTMTVVMEMLHADRSAAAAFIMSLAHVHPRDQQAFPWSARVRDKAGALTWKAPRHAAPRSIDPSRSPTWPTRMAADAAGAPVVGRFMVTPDHCDAFGWMRMELFLGRISDAVPNLLASWRMEVARATGQTDPAQTGGAVLEYRLCPRRWPRAGDLIEVRSSIVEVGEKTNRLVHLALDPVSGDAWCSAEAVAVTFDLVTRKAIAIPAAQRAALEARLVQGLHI